MAQGSREAKQEAGSPVRAGTWPLLAFDNPILNDILLIAPGAPTCKRPKAIASDVRGRQKGKRLHFPNEALSYEEG